MSNLDQSVINLKDLSQEQNSKINQEPIEVLDLVKTESLPKHKNKPVNIFEHGETISEVSKFDRGMLKFLFNL